jgi:hypothetical protein
MARLRKITIPDFAETGLQPEIPAATFASRADAAYARAGCDWLVVYADREHFGNIAFLSGFEPRFEEALLLLGPKGRRVLLAGNECEGYAVVAGLPNLEVLLAQSLSLPGQDRSQHPRVADRLRDAGIKTGDSIGLIGWKYLERNEDDEPETGFFVPAAYVQMLRRAVGPSGVIKDATRVLMHSENGLRAIVDADQIAAWEWAATRASRMVWNMVSGVREGDDEFIAASRMGYAGDPVNCHTMFSSAGPGEHIVGLRSPRGRKLQRGDCVTTAVGLWGALSSRAGLFDTDNDAFLEVASSYFDALCAWYETADIGVEGGALHDAVVGKLAQGGLRSALNPGHLTGHEEWMNSPVRPVSKEKIASGMPFQVDVIPVPMPAGWALNCEDAVTFADAGLRGEIAAKHPDCMARIDARRAFMRNELGIDVKANILPLSSTPLCLPPFWLKADLLLVRD